MKRFMTRGYRSGKVVKEREAAVEKIRIERVRKAKEAQAHTETVPNLPTFSPEFIEEISDAGAHDSDGGDPQ